jgi:hypothetical protein
MNFKFNAYKDTARLTLRAPDGTTYVTANGDDMYIDLHSRRSPYFENALAQWRRERPQKRRRKEPSFEEGKELELRLIIACTAAWNLEIDGEPVPLDEETARQFWSQNPEFREHADAVIDDDEAFLQR